MAQEFVTKTLLFIGVVLGPLSLLILMVWFSVLALQDLRRQLIELHQLWSTPCHQCLYFSGSEELKCAVHPYEALTPAAKDCQDYTQPSSAKHFKWWHHKL